MFIWNCEQDNVCKHILKSFQGANEIWIAVAFLKTSGLKLIFDEIKNAVSRDAKIKIIVGTDFFITEPDAIRSLLDLFLGNENTTLSFAVQKRNAAFHPKLYCFMTKEQATLITGSSNLTNGGLIDNTELCSVITTSMDDDAFLSIRSYIEGLHNPDMSRIVTPLILERYATDYRKYQKQVKVSNDALKKLLRDEIQKAPSLDENTLKTFFERYKKENDIDNTVRKRNIAYGKAKLVLDNLAMNTPSTSANFLSEYEKLVDPQGYWWSGSIFRHKNTVAKGYKEFCKMVREIKMATDKEPDELFAICLGYKKKINGLGFNVITEILNTYRPHDCPVLNNSPIVSLDHFGISEFPHANSFKPAHYRRLKQVLEYINHLCGLGSLGMVDNFLNFVYWKLYRKPNQVKDEFISQLKRAGEKHGYKCKTWKKQGRLIDNIVELSGSINCLVYFKVRSEKPYRWGVTKNRIDELMKSGKKWLLILLYESSTSGYLITSQDVYNYTSKSKWSLGADGDYKVGSNIQSQASASFNTSSLFLKMLTEKGA